MTGNDYRANFIRNKSTDRLERDEHSRGWTKGAENSGLHHVARLSSRQEFYRCRLLPSLL